MMLKKITSLNYLTTGKGVVWVFYNSMFTMAPGACCTFASSCRHSSKVKSTWPDSITSAGTRKFTVLP